MPQKKIVFIYPAGDVKIFGGNDEEFTQQEKTISPPLGILYLAAELIDAGYAVDCCDYNAEKYTDEHLSALIADADLVGISLLSFSRKNAFGIIRKINAMRPGLAVIVGGPDCILHPRPIPGTVLTVACEAEKVIVEIVEAVLAGKSPEQLPGVIFTDASGAVKTGKPYYYVDDLDTIKFPRRDLLRDNKGYSILGKRSRDITTIITSRGCPKKCTFCAHAALAYQKYRSRSAENVVEEIRLIAEQGYRILGIVDDNFTADKVRAKKILSGIIGLGARLTMAVQGRADAADAELFSLMKKAGVVLITFGLESGNQEVLDFYNKGASVETIGNAVRLADRAGLYTAGMFIFGAPMETVEHFRRTYEFAASLPLDVTSFWILDYTYGSILWQRAREQGKVTDEDFNTPAGKERGTSIYPTKFIEEFGRKSFFKFYRRPSYWLRQAVKFCKVHNLYFLWVLWLGLVWLVQRRIGLWLEPVRRLMTNKNSRKKTADAVAVDAEA
ncbi:MAG TPA: radical SAM protein [Chitinivibrionales bacterium]|nr:radical SAM protein [Chitinivibrionales bacterium]